MKNRSKLGCVIAFIIILAVAGVLYFSHKVMKDTKVNKAGEYVVKYLDLKYHRNFVIKSGHYIFNTGGYEFTVYPKDDPKFTFHAWLNSMTESGVSDEYFLSLRIEQGKKLVAPYIKAISDDYYIDVAATGPSSKMKNYDAALANVHENMMSIEQQLKTYPYEIMINLRVHINCNITPKNKNQVLTKVYKLLEFLRQKKFGYIEITLYFYDFPNRSIRTIADNTRNFSLNYRFKAPIWIWFNPQKERTIKKWQDLQKCIIKFKGGREVKRG